MRIVAFTFLVAVVLSADPARAEPPKVVTDIAPVHSLVSAVLGELAEPGLLIRGTASPHDFSMRPSDARLLQDAELVIWIGDALTPWLGSKLSRLAPNAVTLSLLETPGTRLRAPREGALFEPHDHGHGHGETDQDHAARVDPHAWLDPLNAIHWLDVIAKRLSELDPANGGHYAANAATAKAGIRNSTENAKATLAPLGKPVFFVYHDGFHYFEAAFGVEAAGAVSPGDASRPGAARLMALRDRIQALGEVCLFADPQFSTAIVERLAESGTVRLARLDPLGAELPTGPRLYPELLRRMAVSIAECLS